MPQLRLALAQVDPTVGDLDGNADMVVAWARHAAERGAHVVAFPEMMLTGYPIEDLALRPSFVEASAKAIETLAARLAHEGLGELAVIIGYVDRPTGQPGAHQQHLPADASAFLFRGRVVARYAKHHLPNYGVFDEYRYFSRGDRLVVVRHLGVDIAMTVCEDLWQDGGPITAAQVATAGLVVNINASPYERGKSETRLRLAQRRASEAGATLAYVNMVGGQDELVFDGDSLAVTPAGAVLTRAPQFDEGLVVVDLGLPQATDDRVGAVDVRDGTQMVVERVDLGTAPLPAYDAAPAGVAERLAPEAEVYSALVVATRDYVRKNNFRSVVLGLSGGIDSALVATIAVDALGPGMVNTVALPSRWSTEHSLADADELARRQQISHSVVPINDIVEAFEKQVDLHGLAAENLQARVRGTILMALSNEHGHLVLTTGNKSELATGYSTLYGDSAGGFAPIKDVPKSLVWQLARWRNGQATLRGLTPPIPQNSIDKPPSAELRPDQLDSDSLPDYAELDQVLDAYVERDLGRSELMKAGHDEALVDKVVRLVDTAEYKRRQYPPGPKISVRNFGRDRRLPITNRWREPTA
ncbi:MAG TPA: NAD+ synthase [Acidothermaceae bacterium]|nr:NAD+ synthase [Acidothermaceae bacterium]